MTHSFELPGNYKKWTMGLIGVGVIALLWGAIMYHPFGAVGTGDHPEEATRFWAVLLQNSVYWLLLVNVGMFFIGFTTLAMGGWQVALRRVPEAISSVVPVMGIITFFILMAIVWGGRYDIYPWVNKETVAGDKLLSGKSGFLNPMFYSLFSAIMILLWWLLGKKLRSLSFESDKAGTMDYETGDKWIKKNILYASLFIVVFGLSVGSTIPWLWIMSIDAHWYSTMFSWYTFASTFVAGMSLIALFIIFLKNNGQLEYVTDEHLHDIGKFMFAFSIFWTYLWFSQYMLIWYANIPEETGYFKIRVSGPYRGIFFLNLILNFVCPILIMMKKSVKRNYTLMTFMALLIIFGHWIDVWQMVMPGTLYDKAHLGLFEFGIAALFIGVIMWRVGDFFTKHPLTAKNHPFLKESIIHHT
ncbi:MAG TPA: quinol:cytochrome C oxidoreductase [Ferruginibacter sp.]|nr:quinol:cytochrome C oxidoreductase [Ferruginibacter sp.]